MHPKCHASCLVENSNWEVHCTFIQSHPQGENSIWRKNASWAFFFSLVCSRRMYLQDICVLVFSSDFCCNHMSHFLEHWDVVYSRRWLCVPTWHVLRVDVALTFLAVLWVWSEEGLSVLVTPPTLLLPTQSLELWVSEFLHL